MALAQDVKNRIPITGWLMLATLMYTLDSTIANVALSHMQGSLSASQDEITWVLTSYILATAVMTPLAGWLAQKIGRKRMLVYSIVGFTIASMLCGLAQNVPQMVGFRVLQGMAGAGLMPLSQAVMLDIFPMTMIPRVMSLWSAAVIMGPIVGPTLGGWITEELDWRWVFFINLPFGILATLGIIRFMGRDTGGRERPFDFIGFGGLIAFVVGLQMMLDRGPGRDWFDSKEIWVEAAIAVAGLWVFIVQTATSEHPFFHRDLAKDGNFIGTTVFSFLVGVLLFSTTALLPSFMQTLLGYSATQAGLASIPRGVGSLVSFLLVPTIMARFGPRTSLVSGLALSVLGLWMMGGFNLEMTSSPILISGFVQGLGVGLLFSPLSKLAYVTLDQSHRVEGTIVATMARSLGSSVGISIVLAAVLRNNAAGHSELASRIDPSSPMLRDLLPSLMDPRTESGLWLLNSEVARQSGMIGYVNIFMWMALVVCVTVPAVFLLRPPRTPAPDTLEIHTE
ncbi:MAG: DHA2 family efflux MFS transporter permease subunit [Phenylobacterium sp.]|uniref:DHA2 family efflux MFS transporter permease subunit n=1 Tax=Phenylobacterium sp. TaxID=1871053 RepID=UPI002722F54C|nr:DHA2 family efflux MFS transporter permease subunit [Phenylobacterium sp.]MDO8913386.1 DHA2 family efflux MFS transporter permease subunit [Phenylobacterium sp.]MDP3101231.1 DHA2 family efflux MFS transporter permease subunit [Phenylobacterium sp.]